MGQTFGPRHGSMQYWPRVRSKRSYARIRSWASIKDVKLLGFAGYKVGMTHIIVYDQGVHSMTKGMDVSMPVTIIECPPVKIAGVRFYKQTEDGWRIVTEILADKLDKEFGRKVPLPKKTPKTIDSVTDYDDISLLIYTQPKLATIGKKKPEVFEIVLGGNRDEKIAFAKEKLGKEIRIQDTFAPGQFVDAHMVTKGKGVQGPVKRFGVPIRGHKSEKTKRGPGSLGAWCGQPHMMYRVAHAGKMGYHMRTEYNKQILKISDKPEEVNPKGGFMRYGMIHNPFILIYGSVGGASKRLIRLNAAIRPNKKITPSAPQITYIHKASHQGS
jgi:large subunit ribosomal protein L3